MTKKQTEEKWMEGRDRPVRVYLTEDEHALVRRAAAAADKSVSRFSVEAIVEKASGAVQAEAKPAAGQGEPAAEEKPKRPRRKK